jgi:hypothetical protein
MQNIGSDRLLRPLLSLLFLTFVLLVGCTSTGQDATVAKPERVYLAGETGPAGGVVFYDKGERSEDWRFLEVSPVGTQMPLQWGTAGTDVPGTSAELGMGKANTALIVAMLDTLGERGRAAQYCDTLNVNGYTDWFLPSKLELDQLYWQLAFKGVGEFLGLGQGYWSSTEYDSEKAWGQGFSAGVQGRIEKSDIFIVRAVRAF